MLTNHKRRNRALTLAILTLLIGLPELAFAQQSGLFPNAPITRKRPGCEQQDPIYKLYRDQYYGYHPTCWRKFPTGWGCPSPEAPDKEKSFREIERKKPPVDPEAGPDDGDDTPPKNDMNGPADNGPANRRGPSPFEEKLPTIPDGPKSPFDVDPAPAGAPPAGANPAATPPQTNRLPAMPRSNQPELTPPATGRTTSNRSRMRTQEELDDRPMLAMSDEVIPVADGPTESGPTVDEESALPPVQLPPVARPSQPAARRGVLSGLFGGNGWNWRRR